LGAAEGGGCSRLVAERRETPKRPCLPKEVRPDSFGKLMRLWGKRELNRGVTREREREREREQILFQRVHRKFLLVRKRPGLRPDAMYQQTNPQILGPHRARAIPPGAANPQIRLCFCKTPQKRVKKTKKAKRSRALPHHQMFQPNLSVDCSVNRFNTWPDGKPVGAHP
jgi:hypothetical protein